MKGQTLKNSELTIRHFKKVIEHRINMSYLQMELMTVLCENPNEIKELAKYIENLESVSNYLKKKDGK